MMGIKNKTCDAVEVAVHKLVPYSYTNFGMQLILVVIVVSCYLQNFYPRNFISSLSVPLKSTNVCCG